MVAGTRRQLYQLTPEIKLSALRTYIIFRFTFYSLYVSSSPILAINLLSVVIYSRFQPSET